MNAGSKNRSGRDNIYLIGFMAAGKTTVGKLLAQKLNREFFDTDEMIERRSGQMIAQIFSECGERYFREMESAAVAEVARQRRAIVALGGGAILSPKNWLLLSNSGVTIYLKWPAAALAERLLRDSRPLIFGVNENSKRTRVEKLLRERENFYLRADYKISCGDLMAPEQIADEILNVLGNHL
jgi:shikimate kinase